MPDFDPVALGQQLASQIAPRLDSLGIPAEEAHENAEILQEFNRIAADMLTQEQGIEMQAPNGATTMIPLDEQTIVQAIHLFCEGMYFAMLKCAEMGITGDIKKHLLQNLAMDVYNQAKQIVASTYGQEHTPEYQFTHEQQVELMNQGAESALMYYINDYERQFGPIEIEEPPAPLVSKVEKTMAEEGIPLPVPAAQAAQVATPATQPKGPTPHDKYGAVALLLTTLPADQRGRILQNFSVEERELITFYSYPQHMEQNLDMQHVQQHLKNFKETLKQGSPTLKSAAYRGITRLAKSYPVEKLLSYVKDERPAVKQYLESHYPGGGMHQPYIEGLSGPAQSRHFAELLPSRVEEILYRYLAKRLEPIA